MTPEQVKKIMAALEANDTEALAAVCKELLASAAGGGGEPPAEASALDDAADAPSKKPEEEAAALRKELAELKAKQTASEKSEVQKLREELDVVKAERAAKDAKERADLVGDLVKLGVEIPATAWEGEAEKRKPAKRFEAESIDALRARVELLRKAKPVGGVEPPASGGGGPGDQDDATEIAKLSKETLDAIKKKGMTPEQFIHERRGVLKASK